MRQDSFESKKTTTDSITMKNESKWVEKFLASSAFVLFLQVEAEWDVGEGRFRRGLLLKHSQKAEIGAIEK